VNPARHHSQGFCPAVKILLALLLLIIASDNGAILYDSHQYDRAIEQFRYVLEMEPNFPRAGVIVEAYLQKRMFTEAIA